MHRFLLHTLVYCLLSGTCAAEVAIPILEAGHIGRIKTECGQTWLAGFNSESLFLVDDKLKVVLKDPGQARNPMTLKAAAGGCWLFVEREADATSGSKRDSVRKAFRLVDGKWKSEFSEIDQLGDITEVNGQVFLLASDGTFRSPGNIYRLSNDQLVQIAKSIGPIVMNVVDVAGTTWLLASQTKSTRGSMYSIDAAFRLDGDEAVKVGPETMKVRAVVAGPRGPVLMGQNVENAFLFDVHDGKSLSLGEGIATSFKHTPRGDFAVVQSNGKVRAVQVDDSMTHYTDLLSSRDDFSIDFIGDNLFVKDYAAGGRHTDALYVLYNGAFRELSDKTHSAYVHSTAKKVWILRKSEGEYEEPQTLEDGQLKPLAGPKKKVASLYEALGSTWFTTPQGSILKFDGRGLVDIPGPEKITKVVATKDCVWFLPKDEETPHPTWRQCEGDAQPVKWPNSIIRPAGFVQVADEVWLASKIGEAQGISNGYAFSLKKGLKINASLTSSDSWWANAVHAALGQKYWISGLASLTARYEGTSEVLPPPADFAVIIDTDREAFFKRLAARERNEFVPISSAKVALDAGATTVYIAVRDQWGNLAIMPEQSIVVAPGPVAIPVLASLFLFGVAICIMIAAPWSEYCNDLLMNPLLRTYGSFGAIPLLISTVPLARHHILRRYKKELAADPEISLWKQGFVAPDSKYRAEQLDELLNGRRALLILGRSGLGKTTYFRHLAAAFSDVKRPGRSSQNIPVYLPLSRYFPNQKDCAAIFRIQLQKYGGITDASVADSCIGAGGFLFLIDGLNEVDAQTRSNVSAFIDANRRKNRILISSQEIYSEVISLPVDRLPSLSAKEIRELFKISMGELKATAALAHMSDKDLAIFSTPQNITLAAGLSDVASLPKSEAELYSQVFGPAFAAWDAEGHESYKPQLRHRAFKMLVDQLSNLVESPNAVPKAVVDWLLGKRLARQTGEQVEFIHDTVRDYLAAMHFVDEWESVLKDDKLIPAKSWLPMIGFALSDQRLSSAAAMFFPALLARNVDVAGIAYKRWREMAPRLMEPWHQEFLSRFGEATLKAA